MKRYLLLFVVLFQFSLIFGQTPGLIVQTATAPGKGVMDPNGDGYVSSKTNGVQLGFTNPPNNDVSQSEIPYVPLENSDPTGDLYSGPTGGFADIVSNGVVGYFDGANFLIRFRVGDYSANSKGYSVLIDSDQKFGFTGINADPNAINGNPGFEVEIVLKTNFSVDVYNVNGTTAGTLSASHSVSTNSLKAMAVTMDSGNPDYFYDFYIPVSDLATLGITTNTPLRFVNVTSNNPQAAIGNNNISDVGGATTGPNIDVIYTGIIDGQTPTPLSTLDLYGVLNRSLCPSINGVAVANTTISGTSSEPSGTTITVYVYQSNGTSLIGSGTTTTSGTTWSINVSALSPTVTLAGGQIVKATATASGKGASYDNCDIETVTNCTGTTGINVTVNTISGAKGYTITNTFAAGTIFTWYNSDFTIAVYPDKNGSTTMIPNPITSTAANQTITFSTQTGQTFPNGIFYFTFQEPGKCVSSFLPDCQYSNTGTSTTPTITTTNITTSTTSVSGTCGSVASPGAIIYLYVNGVYRANTTVISGTTWTISSLNFLSDLCKSVTISEADAGKCPTSQGSSKIVSRTANSPTINSSGCSTSPPTTISGISSEIGATVTLYRTSPTSATLGTAVVQSDGTWSVSGLTLSNGNVLAAAVTSGSCLLPSANSSTVTISTQTNVSSYTVGFTTPIIQNSTSVSGTISGGTYPVTLKLFVDQTLVGSGVSISAAGNWTVSGLNTFDLAVGSKVQVTLTGTGCESNLSTTFATVQCSPPLNKTISATVTTYCGNSYGTVIVQNSQPNILYIPVASDGTTVYGYSGLGNGSNINLTTFLLSSNPTTIKVKASILPVGTCDILMSGSVVFTVNPIPAAPTGNSTQIFCTSGTTTLADLAVTAPSGSTIKWYSVASGGTSIASSTTVVNGTTYYAESVNSTTGCISSSRTTILVQTGIPAAPTANSSQTFCTGATLNNIVATLSGPGTLNWYSVSSGGTALAGTTVLVNNTTYYAENTQNTCRSTRTPVTTFINLVSGGTIAANQTIEYSGDPAAFTVSVASTGSGTLSYQWQSSTTSTTTGFSNIVGATFSIYDIPSGLTVTTYYKRITTSTINSTACTSESNVLTVTVNPCINPSITTQPPTAASICENNGTANISILATGSGLTYQWYVEGTSLLSNAAPYSGVTTNTLTITNPVLGLNGKQYTVKINGLCGSEITSSATTLTVNPRPVINNLTTTICSGGTFSVSPVNTIDGIVPVSTTYSWSAPTVTGGITGGASVSGAASISGSLINPTSTVQTATYSVTPLSGSCSGTAFNVTVTVNPKPVITVTSNLSICAGDSTTLTASGGLSYSWSPSTGLSATTGSSVVAKPSITTTYTVTGTNLYGCSNTATVKVTVNSVPTVFAITGSTTICNGSTSQLNDATPGGVWSSSDVSIATVNSSGLVTGVTPGSATIYYAVTNGSGCVTTVQTPIIYLSALNVTNTIHEVTCHGGTDGSIIQTVSGGAGSYTYLWGDGPTTKDRTTLTAGNYSVTVKDANNCSIVKNYTITQPSAITATAVINHVSCNSSNNGSINMTVSGGTSPYTFAWSNGSTSEDIGSLAPGTYTDTITDAVGCSLIASETVNNACLTFTKTLHSINENSAATTYNAIGDIISYNIVVTNTGTATFTNILVTDPLTGLSQTIASLASGASQTITTSYTVKAADLTSATITNTSTANFTYNGIPYTFSDSEIVSAGIADLTISKSVKTNQVVSGGELIYKIVVTNNGPAPARNVQITDAVTAFPNPTFSTTIGGTYTAWSSPYSLPGQMANGATDTIYLKGTLAATQCSAVTNSATVSSDNDINTANNSTGTITTIVLDQTSPVITFCPTAISRAVNNSCSLAAINFGTPVATDNCSAVTFTNNAPSIFLLGDTTVTWTATDASGNTSTCTQTVTVTNTAPTAVNDGYSVVQNATVSGNVLLNDIDNEGQSLTVTNWGTPSNGSLISTNSSGVFTFSSGSAGTSTFTYTISDACGLTSAGTVTIFIESCVAPPSIPGPIKITK
jgi:hypothetical protein